MESVPSEDICPISVDITHDRPDQPNYSIKPGNSRKRNLITIKRSNKLLEASNLPTVINLNPRSLYNKQNELAR